MVRNVQLKHSGKYVCAVQTEVDAVSAAADLTVRGTRPPAAPRRHALVTWHAAPLRGRHLMASLRLSKMTSRNIVLKKKSKLMQVFFVGFILKI